MSTTFSELAADRPLEDPSADTLGRVAFAERIAAELLAWQGRDHLVISINGEPGSGKTTVKNFIRQGLAGTASRAGAVVVEFNPWQGTARDDLGCALCMEIAGQIENRAATAGITELAAAWRQLAAAVSNHGNFPAPAGAPARSGATAHEHVRQQLGALPLPLILFVDDVDHLPAPEVQLLVRFLKANLAFPNLVCCLLFSRARIVHALDAGTAGHGAESLRKFVQIEFELPEAPEPLLRCQVEQGVTGILDAASFPARPHERWHDVFSAAVWPWFSTPRDVKRFRSALAFQFVGHFHAQQRVLEVNPIDLVVLESLRMFAHPVYLELRDSFRGRESRLVRLMSGRDEERKEARLEIDQLAERLTLSPREKRAVAAALQHLLPFGAGDMHGRREDWDRDLRLCSPRHSERYFHLGAIPSALPAHRLVEIVRAMDDRAKLEALLLRAAGEGVLAEVLERLPPLLEAFPESHVAASASALSGICDQIPAGAPEDIENRLIRLASDLFARLENPLKRENVMAELLEDASRLTGPILLLHQLRPRAEVPAGSGTTSLSIEQFRRLLKPALLRLQVSAADGGIWRSRECGSLIRRWWEWAGNKDEVREWLLHEVKQPEHARAWLRTFVAAASTAQPRERVLLLEDLSQFCDPALVATAAAQAGGDGIDRAAARTLVQALAPKGTSAGFALRNLVVRVEAEAA